ncbi:PhnD/SsuA/transferrin family substrate-binding protein [Solibacillus sp. MA9]|uniref:PhnD/SsuA/transferrin family substrate-binding protein n=1 Tax=Solibacillus palustris TaxID=2908203 RepID=A0ABS9UDV5_9BACL|nr:PhnD/SsuA/transferrin family substrate-binding protein [Solibacillus sp. MA9]MCH7322527.1 PhnD/SsuA/transferrin family substrate-binding protein [Solibacillus sp. MA9]
MNKKWLTALMAMLCVLFLSACNSSSNDAASTDASTGPVTLVWYPNESGSELSASRDAFSALIKEATGRDVEHKLTTDYAIAIESIANGNAHIAFMGPQGYIEANNKSKDVQALVVPSGESGTLDDAVYYSWLAVPKEKAEDYKVDGEFSMDAIEGKSISFVSTSSTSGFKVPTSSIISHFSDKNLTEEKLMEGNDVFPTVLFGDSHQGSAVNMLMERSDVSAFCDTCVSSYVELVEGEANKPGAVYRVKDDAAAPFNTLTGEEFTLIQVTAVLNSPFVVNKSVLTEEEITKLKEAFISDETANNTEIFVPEDSGEAGLFSKSADERFLEVEDAWFNPIRELSK